MKNNRGGIVLGVVILLFFTLLIAAFPFEIFHYSALENTVKDNLKSKILLVCIRPEDVSLFVGLAKNRLRGADEQNRQQCEGLCPTNLPRFEARPILSVGRRSLTPSLPRAACGMPPFLPSCKATPLVQQVAEKYDQPLPFSREELLKLK